MNEYIIYKDVDLYFIKLLIDHNEIKFLKKISQVNKKYNIIINEKLEDFYGFFKKYNLNENNRDLLNESIKYGKLDVCKYICSYKYMICGSAYTRFKTSCEYGHLDIAKWLWKIYGGFRGCFLAFESACVNGHLNIMKWLYEMNNYNIIVNYSNVFMYSCENGHIEAANWLLNNFNKKINIHHEDEYAFRWSCHNGHLNIAKWLYKLGKHSNSEVNIHANGEFAFEYACAYSHIQIINWLMKISKGNIDIHSNHDFAFKWSCINGHTDVAKWLYGLPIKQPNKYGQKIKITSYYGDLYEKCRKRGHDNIIEWLKLLRYCN